MDDVHFRVSSGLKSIIGRELITDDFIAVFELVKNSFDANVRRVDITFEDLDSDKPRLIIRDNGKGMDKQDLEEKWLFVAYSAKKDGTEDYREQIRSSRIYAGAKGIGRFSCDKLGHQLELLTRKSASSVLQCLNVEWDRFEQDAKEEFIHIPAALSTRRKAPSGFKKGTILEISGLRESWDRNTLLKLKRSLEKLINPNQGNDANAFEIHLHAKDELAKDAEVDEHEPWNRVNGKIENFLFEELKIKSTYIHTSITATGDTISTRLEDRGRFVYRIVEDNDFELLRDIDIHLFVLNQSAKNIFTRRMGVYAVQYGSIFLFKNGFRIYPFGEPGEDIWGIDHRKQQGQARFLGTRDLIGRVEINGDNSAFQEASSRDGGLIKNDTVAQLLDFFFNYALRRLERFAIDIIKWGNKELPDGEFRAKVLELILQLTKSKSLLEVDYDPKIIDILKEASEKSLKSLVNQFRRIAEKSDNPQLEKDARRAERRIRDLEKAKEEAEAEAEKAEDERKKAEEEAEAEREKTRTAEATARRAEKESSQYESQNLFLQSLVSADTANLVGLHHHIGIAAGTIQNYIQSMTKRIRSGKPVSTEMFLSTLEKISLQASQIASSAKFGAKANFSMEAALIQDDLVGFIREYVMNVCRGFVFTNQNREMKFAWKAHSKCKFDCRFRPFEIVVLLDNLISNAKKAGAKAITLSVEKCGDDGMTMAIRDDGKGIPSNVGERVFELGYTTTNGSGFGLYHAAKIAENLGGSLRLSTKRTKGAEFTWEITR